jgi:hypothetical protein
MARSPFAFRKAEKDSLSVAAQFSHATFMTVELFLTRETGQCNKIYVVRTLWNDALRARRAGSCVFVVADELAAIDQLRIRPPPQATMTASLCREMSTFTFS